MKISGGWRDDTLLLRQLLYRNTHLILNNSTKCFCAASELLNSLHNLQSSCVHASGLVDYAGLRAKTQWNELSTCVFVVPTETLAARAFWINLYNALVLHASILSNADNKSSLLEQPRFFKSFAYQVQFRGQELALNLDEIEHGVLRQNRRAFFGWPVFKKNDLRLQLVLPTDARIHFALNCGAVSCPAIRSYDGANLDQQLNIATAAYLQDVQVNGQVVFLPKLFYWYSQDFGGNQKRILDFVRQHRTDLPEQLKHLRFLAYNWSINKVG